MYQHHNWQGALLDYPVSKVICVGSNYAKHIQEMGNAVPDEPVLFIKPETALCDIRQPLVLPQGLGSVHHEVELAVLIGATLRRATEEHVESDCGLRCRARPDPARRPEQNEESGAAVGKAKGFDNSCPISGFVPVSEFTDDPQNTPLSLKVNGEIRQQGTTADMIHKIVPLIAYMSRFFTLKPGDVILTGTPEGVGPLHSGDELDVSFNGLSLKTRVL